MTGRSGGVARGDWRATDDPSAARGRDDWCGLSALLEHAVFGCLVDPTARYDDNWDSGLGCESPCNGRGSPR
jgi:hypothetical protein